MSQKGHADDGHAVFCNTPQNSWLVRNADHRRGIVHRGRHHSHPTKISQTDEEIASCSRGMKYGSENFRVRVYSDTGKIDVDSLAGNFTRFSRAKRYENLYRGLVRSLLHPLGAPDTTSELRPGDLLDYLRKVFDVERADHELYIMEEMPNRPVRLQANVTVLEANGLRGVDFSEDTCNSYCLIMNQPARGKNSSASTSPRMLSPQVSPKFIHRNSPRGSASSTPTGSPVFSSNEMAGLSPQLVRKGANFSEPAIARTRTVKNSSHPKWNESFVLEIEDFHTDELHIHVCDEEGSLDTKPEKKPLKAFLSVLRHSSEQDTTISDGCFGKIVVPVRDILALGTDEWYDIMSIAPSKGKPRAVGKCHLRLSISYRLVSYHGDRCHYSSEDYLQAYRQFLKHTYATSRKNPSRHVGDQYGCMSLKDHRILKMFAEAHCISKLSQAIVNVICLLELQCEDELDDRGDFTLLYALEDLHITWAAMQIGQQNVIDRMPLTDIELSNYRRVAARYIQLKSSKVDELPPLFPPSMETLHVLKARLCVVVQLLSLDLWEASCDPKADISDRLTKKLQAGIEDWIQERVAEVHETKTKVRDKVTVEIENLIELVNVTASHCTILPVLRLFFNSLGINYYRLVSFTLEKMISAESMKITEKMNQYKKRYHNFSVNIMMASRQSLRLYFSVRTLHGVIRENVSRRDSFRLGLSHYQDWFEESMNYWLQTFRTECVQRMEKALEIDKDVVVVTSLVKYSHSSVDVLSCFAQVIGEWRKIDIRDPDSALMGVINVTDIICDGARLYAQKIQSILERNCYYDNNRNAEFDINDRLCITVNNIEHVRLYLSELSELLAWDTVIMMISTSHNDDAVGKQAHDTLQRLIDTANEEILSKCAGLLQQICDKMKVVIDRFTELFTKKSPEKTSSVDPLLGYIATNLQTLEDQLMPKMFPYMIEQLWSVVISTLCAQLKPGNHPEYYLQMKSHLRCLMSFFGRSGLDDRQLANPECEALRDMLDINAKHTDKLMLEYFENLASDVVTPTESYGHLAYKASYLEETRGNITTIVTVLRGSELPGLDTSGYSDPYVEVSLQPQSLFGFSRSQKTHIIKQNLNPVFNVTFQFPNIPREALKQSGSCILLSVFDHDHIGRDDFAGEVVIPLTFLKKVGMAERSMDRMPAIIMPLKRPKKPNNGPYKILSLREWDKVAKKFIVERNRFIHRQPVRTDKPPDGGGFFSSFFSTFTN
ncbi:protein unc-13 homolog D-like [Mya arenaria]|uniref:protein unc-13 homolog D-like n=1 Tax=Mya arenaria TaxID=6604 RepID=UPI0022E877DD|nr:protein unc-13 homolog D-like [Mya arenaria]